MVKHTQTNRRLLPTNCLSVFDHFMGLALRRLSLWSGILEKYLWRSSFLMKLLRKTPTEFFFNHRFQNTYFTQCLSVAASKIHKFLTSFMKLALEMKLLLDFTVLKSYVGIATNLHKICSRLTIKAPERHQLNSLQCLYCKLYTPFWCSG